MPGGASALSGLPFSVPLILLLVVALLTPLVAIVLMPFGLVQRYRSGKARRVARGWVASINFAALLISSLLFLGGAAVTNLWVPHALVFSLAGFAAGGLLALVGLRLTRWENVEGKLNYTPNRWLALLIVLLVTARLGYGLWRLAQGWQLNAEDRAWLLESGIPGSLATGALVLGYTLCFWLGVGNRTRLRQPYS
jgi:hypothetical protein